MMRDTAAETGVGVVGLEHLNLSMPKGAEAAVRAFYGDLLGLAEIPKAAALEVHGGCWFSLGDVALHLGVAEPFVPAKKAHPAFLVGDLEAARARFEAAGAEVRLDTRVPQVRRFYADDPFGNRLEFIQAGDRF